MANHRMPPPVSVYRTFVWVCASALVVHIHFICSNNEATNTAQNWMWAFCGRISAMLTICHSSSHRIPLLIHKRLRTRDLYTAHIDICVSIPEYHIATVIEMMRASIFIAFSIRYFHFFSDRGRLHTKTDRAGETEFEIDNETKCRYLCARNWNSSLSVSIMLSIFFVATDRKHVFTFISSGSSSEIAHKFLIFFLLLLLLFVFIYFVYVFFFFVRSRIACVSGQNI